MCPKSQEYEYLLSSRFLSTDKYTNNQITSLPHPNGVMSMGFHPSSSLVVDTKRPTMRKRSRSEPSRDFLVLDEQGPSIEPLNSSLQHSTQATICNIRKGSGKRTRKDMLLWSLLLGIVSLSLRVTCTSAALIDDDANSRILREKRLEADRKIRERFLNMGPDEDCIDCIVTFAERPGNVDSSFGNSAEYTRYGIGTIRGLCSSCYGGDASGSVGQSGHLHGRHKIPRYGMETTPPNDA